MVIEHREVFSCRECGEMFEIKASIPSTEVLHCTAVFSLALYSSVLYGRVQFWTILQCAVLQCAVVHCSAMCSAT